MADHALIAEVAADLRADDPRRVSRAVEVACMLTKAYPGAMARYASALTDLLNHRTARVRQHAMHALARMALAEPSVIAGLLPRIATIVRDDPSGPVREYAVDACGQYAGANSDAARAAFPLLRVALGVAKGKHAAPALLGLAHVGALAPELREGVRALAQPFTASRSWTTGWAAEHALRAAGASVASSGPDEGGTER